MDILCMNTTGESQNILRADHDWVCQVASRGEADDLQQPHVWGVPQGCSLQLSEIW